MAWLHMHKKKTTSRGMGPNLMCNVEKKMLKIILKDGMTRWVESQTLELKLAQDLSQTQ